MELQGVSATAYLAVGMKCLRCRMIRVEVGKLWKWPDICHHCADFMDHMEREAPDPVAFYDRWQKHFEDHPIRTLALDPTVSKLVKAGRIIEVWGRPDQMPWVIRNEATTTSKEFVELIADLGGYAEGLWVNEAIDLEIRLRAMSTMTHMKVGDSELPLFRLDSAPIGQRVVIIEAIEDEYRWKHLARREFTEGEVLFNPKYIPVTTYRTVQGRLGQKPRWDSGENSIATQMPSGSLVVDAAGINHDWTEAYAGVVVVEMMCWMGVYVNSKLVWKNRPIDLAMVTAVVGGLEDMPFTKLYGEYDPKVGVLPDDLTKLRFVKP